MFVCVRTPEAPFSLLATSRRPRLPSSLTAAVLARSAREEGERKERGRRSLPPRRPLRSPRPSRRNGSPRASTAPRKQSPTKAKAAAAWLRAQGAMGIGKGQGYAALRISSSPSQRAGPAQGAHELGSLSGASGATTPQARGFCHGGLGKIPCLRRVVMPTALLPCRMRLRPSFTTASNFTAT